MKEEKKTDATRLLVSNLHHNVINNELSVGIIGVWLCSLNTTSADTPLLGWRALLGEEENHTPKLIPQIFIRYLVGYLLRGRRTQSLPHSLGPSGPLQRHSRHPVLKLKGCAWGHPQIWWSWVRRKDHESPGRSYGLPEARPAYPFPSRSSQKGLWYPRQAQVGSYWTQILKTLLKFILNYYTFTLLHHGASMND